jgi:hypothetical protein
LGARFRTAGRQEKGRAYQVGRRRRARRRPGEGRRRSPSRRRQREGVGVNETRSGRLDGKRMAVSFFPFRVARHQTPYELFFRQSKFL